MPDPLAAEQNTLRIIHDEHGSLASIIRGLQFFVREIDQGKPAPDLKMFRAMLYYINEFPDRMHHAKEDRHLFASLRRRTEEVDDALADLEHQHEKGAALLQRLNRALARYEFEGAAAFPAFRALVAEYASFYYSHMRLEEEVVLPAASRYLRVEDWAAIETAFANNRDPLTGADLKSGFDKLFTLIAEMAPPPAA